MYRSIYTCTKMRCSSLNLDSDTMHCDLQNNSDSFQRISTSKLVHKTDETVEKLVSITYLSRSIYNHMCINTRLNAYMHRERKYQRTFYVTICVCLIQTCMHHLCVCVFIYIYIYVYIYIYIYIYHYCNSYVSTCIFLY